MNNPVNYIDRSGTTAETFQWWVAGMWWLPFVDAILPIGDLIYVTGIVILYAIAYSVSDDISSDLALDDVDVGYSPPSPDNDDDDDYYDDDDNFSGRERMGKSNGKTPRNNQAQNKQVKSATQKLPKNIRQRVHWEISHQGVGYHEIVEITKDLLIFVIGIFNFCD